MPWEAKHVMDLRIDFVLRARRQEVSLSALCREFGISRPTGYLWLRRFEGAGSISGLAERSRRPLRSPNKTPEVLEEAVIALRQRFSWGARKLGEQLKEKGISLPEITIHRILKRRGLVDRPEERRKATGRFEREECNQLLQMDFKGEYPIHGGEVYPLSLLDDHSRYLLGLWPLTSPSAEGVKLALEPFFRDMGVPQALLLDHGTPWWSSSNGHGLTALSVWLMKQEIHLIFAAIAHPQTQGKVERLHRTLKERTRHAGLPPTLADWCEWADYFRTEYNELRPHEALGMLPPAQVYRPENLRPYQENPPEPDYGDAATAGLNSAGCLYWQGRQWFVCEALAGERVRVDELDGLLLVSYRTTTVREINLRTGRTQAVVLPASTIQKCKGCPDNTL
jgi:transposase InsO family protein